MLRKKNYIGMARNYIGIDKFFISIKQLTTPIQRGDALLLLVGCFACKWMHYHLELSHIISNYK